MHTIHLRKKTTEIEPYRSNNSNQTEIFSRRKEEVPSKHDSQEYLKNKRKFSNMYAMYTCYEAVDVC